MNKYAYYKVIQEYWEGWNDSDFHETDSTYCFKDRLSRDLFRENVKLYRENAQAAIRVINRKEAIAPITRENKTMTPSELKRQVENRGTETHFFSRETMRFFGDTMSNYGVRKATIIHNITEKPMDCWELYRRKPVKHGCNSSAYFDMETFYQVFAKS